MSAEAGEVYCNSVERRLFGFSSDDPITMEEYEDAVTTLITRAQGANYELERFLEETRSLFYSVHPLTFQILKSMGYNPLAIYALAISKGREINSHNYKSALLTTITIRNGMLNDRIIQIKENRQHERIRITFILPIGMWGDNEIHWHDSENLIYSSNGQIDFPESIRIRMPGQHLGRYIDHPGFRNYPAIISTAELGMIKLEPVSFVSLEAILGVAHSA